jgi:hypothetical protein
MAKTPRKKTRKLAKSQPQRKKPLPQATRKAKTKRPARSAPKPKSAQPAPPPQKRKSGLPFALVGVDPQEPIKVGEDEDGEPITVTSALPKNWTRAMAETNNLDEGEPGRELNPREQLFVEAYLGRANKVAARAARMAGYNGTPESLRVTGHQVLMRTNVQRAIGTALLAVKADRQSLLDVALRNAQASLAPFIIPVLDSRGNMHHALSVTAGAEVGALEWLKEISEDIGAAGIVSRKLKVHDKRPYLEFAAKLMNLFTDRVNVNLVNQLGQQRIEDMTPEDQRAEITRLLGPAAGEVLNPRMDDVGTLPAAANDVEAKAGMGPARIETPGQTFEPPPSSSEETDLADDDEGGDGYQP